MTALLTLQSICKVGLWQCAGRFGCSYVGVNQRCLNFIRMGRQQYFTLNFALCKQRQGICFKSFGRKIRMLGHCFGILNPTFSPVLIRSSTLCYSSFLIAGGSLLLYTRKIIVFCEVPEQRGSRILSAKDDTVLSDDSEFDWNKFFHLMTPEVWYIIVAVLSAFIVAALNIQIPLTLGSIVNAVTRSPAVCNESQNRLAEFFARIKKPALKLLYMYVSQSAFTFLYISTLSYAGERFASRLRQLLFASILKQDIAFFDKHKTGELISILTTDVQEFKSSFKLCVSQGLRSITQACGCVVSLYLISPKMTGLMLVVLPAVIAAGTSLGTILRKMSKQAQAQIARATSVADEAIGNIRTVRAFAMEDKEQELYNREVEAAEKSCTKLGIGIGMFQGLANLTLNGIVLSVLCIGGSLLATDEITPGSLMSFLVATQTIQRSLTQISLLFGQFVRGMAAGSRVFQHTNYESTIPLSGGYIIPKASFQGEVKFDKVTFTYPTRPHQVILQDFSLALPPGKVVALCGLSGGGKSTVAALLERFYDVTKGSIMVDGYDIRDLDPSWLRGKAIGFINQEPVLFATSVMENIRYGKPDATDEEVLAAAKLANAHQFISNFPKGYNTVLGERGVTVSGGQKQRIAIARALLKDPAILILDEATSALDAESEKLVQDALDHVVKGRTVLVIAHRLSTIQNADVIAVLAKGKIVEIGTHRSLRRKKGIYWELIRKQQFEEVQGQSDQESEGVRG